MYLIFERTVDAQHCPTMQCTKKMEVLQTAAKSLNTWEMIVKQLQEDVSKQSSTVQIHDSTGTSKINK